MLWQTGVFMVCVAVVVLIACLVPAIVEIRRAVKETQLTLSHMQAKLEQTAEESSRLIRLTNQVVEDVQGKIKAADGFVEAMEQTGEAASRLSQSVKLASRTLSETVMEARTSLHNRQDTVRDLIELTSVSMQLWQRWQSSRSPKEAKRTDEQS